MNDYVVAPVGIINDTRLGSKHIVAFLALSAMADDDGNGRASVGMLNSRFQKINTSTIRGVIDYLERCGWVVIYSRDDAIEYHVNRLPTTIKTPTAAHHGAQNRHNKDGTNGNRILPEDQR